MFPAKTLAARLRSAAACSALLLLFLPLAVLPGCSQQSAKARQLAQLKELHDSGVLSDDEYAAKVAALKGGTAGSGAAVHSAQATGNVTRGGGSGQTWKLKKVEWKTMIGYDAMPQWGIPAVPQREVVGATILAPADWDTRIGADQSPTDCSYNIGRLIVSSLSQDKKYGFVMLPGKATVWSNNRAAVQAAMGMNGDKGHKCEMAQPQPLAQRIGAVLKQMVPTAEAVGPMQPIPGLTDKLPAMLQQANASLAQTARQAGIQPSTLQAEAGRIRFTNHDKDGDGEGYLYMVQTVRVDHSPSGDMVTTDTPVQFFTGTPVGMLDKSEPLFQEMSGSLNIGPEYQQSAMQVSANIQHIHEVTRQRLNQIYGEMAADNARTAANIANIQAGVSQYRSQVMNNVAANRSAALEHSSQQFSMYMGDQALYHDPSTGQNVQLPSGSNHVWASTTGNTNEYILTDSPSYNPNGKVGSAGWSEMTEVR